MPSTRNCKVHIERYLYQHSPPNLGPSIMRIKNIFQSTRQQFEKVCISNGLKLDYEANKDTLFLLKSIFVDREYADYFPFYEDAIIVDLGAHYGYFSLFARQNTGAGARIISLEPDKKNMSVFSKNILSTQVKGIEGIQAAVGGVKGELKLYLGNSINNSLVENYALNKNSSKFDLVKVMTLEQVLREKQIPHIDFLKMDCEGAEYEIVFGSPPEVFEKVTTISMEFHDLKKAGSTGNALVKSLTNKGFRIKKFKYDASNLGLNYGKIIATKL